MPPTWITRLFLQRRASKQLSPTTQSRFDKTIPLKFPDLLTAFKEDGVGVTRTARARRCIGQVQYLPAGRQEGRFHNSLQHRKMHDGTSTCSDGIHPAEIIDPGGGKRSIARFGEKEKNCRREPDRGSWWRPEGKPSPAQALLEPAMPQDTGRCRDGGDLATAVATPVGVGGEGDLRLVSVQRNTLQSLLSPRLGRGL